MLAYSKAWKRLDMEPFLVPSPLKLTNMSYSLERNNAKMLLFYV